MLINWTLQVEKQIQTTNFSVNELVSLFVDLNNLNACSRTPNGKALPAFLQ